MKKILSCVMALSIAACAAMSASAADSTLNEGTPSATMNLTYKIDNATYSVTIPESIALSGTDAQTVNGIEYEITGGKFAHGKKLKLSVSNADDLKLYCEQSASSHEHYVSCAIYKGGAKGTGTLVSDSTLIAEAEESGTITDLYVDDINTDYAGCAGTYTGSITFSAEVA